MGNYSSLILIALMVVAFYLLILRPQKKRQEALQQTMNSLTPGTRVLLGSGLFGTVVAVGAKQALIELSAGVEVTVLKQAIVRVVHEGDEEAGWESADEIEDDVEPLPSTDGAPSAGAGTPTDPEPGPTDTSLQDPNSGSPRPNGR